MSAIVEEELDLTALPATVYIQVLQLVYWGGPCMEACLKKAYMEKACMRENKRTIDGEEVGEEILKKVMGERLGIQTFHCLSFFVCRKISLFNFSKFFLKFFSWVNCKN